jgi:transcriptional regulator with XRE-family HTH domain
MELQMARILSGYTQVELAKKMRVTQAAISFWERGICNISKKRLKKT